MNFLVHSSNLQFLFQKKCESYKEAVKLDQYLAVAQFQMGVSYFLVGNFESALISFNDAFLVNMIVYI